MKFIFISLPLLVVLWTAMIVRTHVDVDTSARTFERP